ncbi:MAG TPA: S41 family peptidase [Thermoanaerobaculia bacterium]|nr:S41 family peptidase [Thermoanaerobaculia bacterium]
MTKRALLLLALLFALPLRAATETERLVTLARVWSDVRYLHPFMLTRSIDWDAALVHAIPAVRAAKTDDELANAIDAMLRELGDPATRVAAKSAPRAAADVQLTRTEGDVLILNLGPYAEAKGADVLYGEMRNLPKQLLGANAVLIDVRYSGSEADDLDWILTNLEGFTTQALPTPPLQAMFHSGYRPQLGDTSGGYYTAMLTVPGPNLRASRTAPARIAIITDGTSRLPLGALALHDAGAALISSAPFGDEVVAMTRPEKITPDRSATIRVALPLAGGIGPDAVVADPVAEALAVLRGEKPMPARHASVAAVAAVPQWKPDATYSTLIYPDLEYRLLAAFRLWSVIDRFYPYKNLIGDWDAVLAEFIPRFIDAKNLDEYGAAVVEMDARVEDGHSGASGHPSADKIYGTLCLPFEVRRVEGQFVVTRVLEPSGANVGDVVVSIDGEPFADRVARLRKYIPASTEAARVNRIASVALRGSRDSIAALKLQGADGAVREVSVPRVPFKPLDKSGASWRLLDGDDKDIGYVDLMKLMPGQVDEMFTALDKTRAIVFDLRGYPNGTAWPIAPHVNTRGAKIGAQFRRAQFSGINTVEEGASGFFFEQPLPSAEKPKYRGKMVVLIDDRAISQSEHSCLFFEAANGATFIGSPTAGANGDVTNLTLPGGFRIGFTGHDVRHADGRQLQRLGIQPDVAVEPTIAGLRAGRDEVLERALAYIHGLPR